MFMDDNAHLIEWLAYHYHALPLRRLILAVDPRSETSPTEILNRWEGKIEVTQWTDVDFMPPHLLDAHTLLLPFQHKELTNLFDNRQEQFYARCMARLKYEGRSWTALVDTDEYISPNSHAHDYSEILRPPQPPQTTSWFWTTTHYSSPRTVWDVLQRAHRMAHNVTTSTPFGQKFNASNPCLPMARLAFGVQESTKEDLFYARQDQLPSGKKTSLIPWGFEPLDFQTMRWRWIAGRGKKSINKISKALIDVSRVESSLFLPKEEVMVHLPIKRYCKGKDALYVLNTHSLLVVHHYSGTWEQWSHRNDTRGRRTFAAYQQMQYNHSTEDSLRPWLNEFVREMGWWTALRLLKGVGKVPPRTTI